MIKLTIFLKRVVLIWMGNLNIIKRSFFFKLLEFILKYYNLHTMDDK